MKRSRRLTLIILAVFLGMFIIPLFAVNTVKPDVGMLVALILFYVLNLVFSLFLGIASGKDIKFFWFVPILIAVLFWRFSSLSYKTEFPIVYSKLHLVLCGITIALAVFLNRKSK